MTQNSQDHLEHQLNLPERIDANLPKGMAAWSITSEIQERAAQKGFEWPDVGPVLSKILEEHRELEEAVDLGDHKKIESELGDLLFIVLKAAKFLGIDPEEALNLTNRKFAKRFQHVEKHRQSKSLEEMMSLWKQAKSME